jgi:hypothetical protein
MKLLTGILVVVFTASTMLYAAPAQVTVTPSSLTFGSVIVEDISAEQSYQLTGNKNSIIDVTAPAGFGVSLTSGGPYTSTLAVPPVGGGVNATIYVVFTPVAIQAYSDNIANVMQSHLVDANVSVTGTGIGTENPASFNAVPGLLATEIDLDWTKNANDDDCMIARTTDGIFGTPVNGSVYNVNDTIPGGGLVMYKGIDLMYDDTGLTPNTLYYYKIFSFGSVGGVDPVYSSGLEDSATTTPEPGAAALLLIATGALIRKMN